MSNLDKVKKYLNGNLPKVFEKLGVECFESEDDPIICKCPIHDGDNERSLAYYRNGNWVCWTHNCHQEYGNDIFGLIKGYLSKDKKATFSDVMRWINKEFGINTFGKYVPEKPINKEFIVELNDKIHITKQNFNIVDRSFKDIEIPSDYFVKRRFYDKKTMEFFGVGDSKCRIGISRNRAVIPVHNDDGSIVIANLYRATKNWLEPKFLIDKGFDKTNYLYNYHRAKDAAKSTKAMFLLEGSGDVWRMYESGVFNCVSIMGKELSAQQRIKLDSLSVFTIIVLLDNDSPGKESKVQLMRDLSRFYNLIFPKFGYKRDIGKMSPDSIKTHILRDLKGYY